ncbi:Chemotaxis protein methyltransferase CheR [hydrothermal vent metagenome]|uniref:protein-glutamate O-methyltransferase n=1 Tax=hydrothermal vent metagenome TaxID=652676 RepID=A0A3B1AW64_9ZZZZ
MQAAKKNAQLLNNREFEFSAKDFKYISDVIADRTGIVLSEAKHDMVYSRLARRLRQLKFTEFSQYLSLIKSGDKSEILEFTNAITTNLTSFFREKHHFEYLRNKVLPELKKTKTDRRIRVWSAGCSSGEEPYSIAMTIRDVFPRLDGWDIKILATDLDTNMVQRASDGIYTEERVAGLDKAHSKKWVKRGKGEHEGDIRMSKELRDMITFKQLNLMDDWPISGPFDFMFCRNVVIYFNKETQRDLFDRYANLVDERGHLFIGHSESLHKVCQRFDLIGQTIYQKVK